MATSENIKMAVDTCQPFCVAGPAPFDNQSSGSAMALGCILTFRGAGHDVNQPCSRPVCPARHHSTTQMRVVPRN